MVAAGEAAFGGAFVDLGDAFGHALVGAEGDSGEDVAARRGLFWVWQVDDSRVVVGLFAELAVGSTERFARFSLGQCGGHIVSHVREVRRAPAFRACVPRARLVSPRTRPLTGLSGERCPRTRRFPLPGPLWPVWASWAQPHDPYG